MKDNKHNRCGRKFKDQTKTSVLNKVMLQKGVKTSELHRRIEDQFPREELSYASLLKSVKGERSLKVNELKFIAEILEVQMTVLID
jgi:hypothetical protein